MKIKAQVISNAEDYFKQLSEYEDKDPILREYDKPEMKIAYATIYIQKSEIKRFKIFDGKIIIETYDDDSYVCEYNRELIDDLEILFNELDLKFYNELTN